jgi:hypothetical protein
LHRLGCDYRKPHKMPRGLNDVRQQAFIASYEKLLNTMAADEAVVFVDAVHPTHQVTGRGMLGAEGHCDRGRTNDRAPKPEHSWCHQP